MHAAADLTTASGKSFRGFVTVSTLTGPPQVTQGVLFRGNKGLFISNPEAIGARAARNALAVALNMKPRELFPIAFRLRVPVEGNAKYAGGVLP